jgi:hypothetical protein
LGEREDYPNKEEFGEIKYDIGGFEGLVPCLRGI